MTQHQAKRIRFYQRTLQTIDTTKLVKVERRLGKRSIRYDMTSIVLAFFYETFFIELGANYAQLMAEAFQVVGDPASLAMVWIENIKLLRNRLFFKMRYSGF